MLKTKKFAVLAIVAALSINPVFAEEKTAAVVNGVAISQERVDTIVAAEISRGQADTPELRKQIREKMINLTLISDEAIKQGLDKNADVVKQLDQIKQEILANALLQDFVKNHPVSEEQLKAEYDKIKNKFGDKEYNARHILVATEAEAKSIIAQLNKKAKFEQLASKSLDTASGKNGGSLGWTPNQFVAPFANALLNLKKGETTQTPVQTQFGWHIIRLDDVRPMKVPGFEEVKPQLQQGLQQQSIQKFITDLRANAKID